MISFQVKYLEQKEKKWLFSKSDISGFIDNSDLDKKIAALAKKSKLKAKQDKIMDFQAFDLSYVCDKSNLEDNSKQHCLVFQPVYN